MIVSMRGVKTQIVMKNLPGKLWGECSFDRRTIRIDPRQGGREMMNTLIHETLHACEPDMDEQDVRGIARSLTTVLRRMGYRKVDNA